MGQARQRFLKLLSRITEPTEGRAVLHGRVGSLLEVGTGFHPELTGRENVYLNGAILGMSRTEINKRFDEIVEFSEVEALPRDACQAVLERDASSASLRRGGSSGTRDPVVDEVLAVGDVAFQRKCLGKMGNVAREGRTVLFVSHNMRVVGRLCDKRHLAGGGKVAAAGSDGGCRQTIPWLRRRRRGAIRSRELGLGARERDDPPAAA